ncbi:MULTISPECIES: PIN-like domain-containing protein [unclassified Micromonospora]|uniref:PIN-like domain-containing protein n=1 Tax=unclassified Micromonospora TaxID=2617518 RepID=UPI001C2317E5|nr:MULTISPECIES: PIN-like domain-containing protein [unclassified Micromonospora]MBU8857227.1 restriction endonuclease [Micromonospora sp. WMMB482]MDM4782848.1 PIN-like domain-containing protein [Micromonospora sp. b486]
MSSGLSQAFRSWTHPETESEPFLGSGLVVLDASALLHLYRVTTAARRQIFAALKSVETRLWLPHQACAEFHRNRLDVVAKKMSQFRETRTTLLSSNAKAVTEIRKAITRLVEFRQYNMTSREWDPQTHGLDEESILGRLDGLLDPALAELKALQAEHDIGPGDVTSADPVLEHFEDLTRGKLGDPYNHRHLMEIVSEAVEFRFPNEMPPGYEDAEKKSPYRAAGDYILWRQVLDRAAQLPNCKHVALVTNDVKPDWWIIDKKGNPLRARPELGQELFEHTGAQLKLFTLSDFLEAAAGQFPGSVSDDIVQAVRKSEAMVRIEEMLNQLREVNASTDGESDGKPDLLSLPPFIFEQLTRVLFIAMGYRDVASAPQERDAGYDIRARHPHSNIGDGWTLIEAKRYAKMVGSDSVRALLGSMRAYGAEAGIFVTTSTFGPASRAIARTNNIQLVDGEHLLRLLSEFLGIDATISSSPKKDI